MQGFTIWFTGLSGSGKSTLAQVIFEALTKRKIPGVILDGDQIREMVSKDLGFSKEDRDEQVRRVGNLCKALTDSGLVALAALISPYEDARELARVHIGSFFLVHCDCSLDELRRRDVKGLYALADAGRIDHFTGVSDPYERPLQPDVVVDTGSESIVDSADKILKKLKVRGLIQ